MESSSTQGPSVVSPDAAVVRATARGVLARRLLARQDLVEAPLPPRLGRYEVLGPLGDAPGRRAVRARDPLLERDVRVEVADAGLELARLERLRAELRALGRAGHPGLPAVHDAGVLEDGRPFFVLELVEQPSLRDRWPGREAALDAVEAAARACHAAHEAGVLHLDLNPSQLLVGERTVVVGFGLAGLRPPEAPAPEQQDPDGSVGAFTDVFALGAILHEVLAGVSPGDASRPLRELAPGAPRALVDVALRALEERPRRRFGSAAELARALAAGRRPGGAPG